jgi:uncharacterized protein with ATP-grasp and redox domains
MKVHLDCFPCFLKQALIALRLSTNDKTVQEHILKSVLDDIKRADTSQSPAYTTTFIHRTIRQLLGRDPFKGIKSEYNQIALGLYPSLRNIIRESPDPLQTSTRLAIAGNVIDFGIFTSIDIEGTIKRSLDNQLAVDDYGDFRNAVGASDEILYITDNAGEIVFDRLLVETLISLGKNVIVAVKGAPVINDATVEDAIESGLTHMCDVIDNGSEAVGTILQWTSSEFQETFNNAQLIISKGQGNFETLFGTRDNMFFLFQSKCHVVSQELGLPIGSMILKKS